MFVDTVAALVRLDTLPDRGVFDGGSARFDFESGARSERLWVKQRGGEYAPRVAFWPAKRVLRVEFSVQKLGNGDLAATLAGVDWWLRRVMAGLPPVATWQCQRVDYCADFPVGEWVGAYLAAVGGLQLSRFVRVGFAGDGEGVVFKSGMRWVKFYDKKHEREGASGGVLRFEVSNFRLAVLRMARDWFGCERTVEQMTRPGRALYVLAYYLERLGLSVDGFGESETLAYRLRERYGGRALAGALHAHECIRKFGTASWRSLGLMSRANYYRWLGLLREDGFLAETDKVGGLEPLILSLSTVLEGGVESENLKSSSGGGSRGSEKKYGGKNGENGELWGLLAEKLGVKRESEPVLSLLGAFEGALNG